MTIQAQLADGRVLEFPDGTDPAVIQATVRRMIQPAQQPQLVREDVSLEAQRELTPEQQDRLVQTRQAQRLAAGFTPEQAARVPTRIQEETQLENLRRTAPQTSVFARDLPEISEAPELQSMDISALRPALASLLITNEAELAGAFTRLVPGTEVLQDPEGNPLVRFPSGGTFAINKPGPSRQDFDQFAARFLAFLPTGRIIGAGARQLGTGALAAGGTEAALQAAEAGLEGEFNALDVVLAAGLQPAAQALPAASSRIRDFIRAQPEGEAAQVLAAGQREGVPVTTSDVIPPETFFGRSIQQLGEKIGVLGTGPQRVAQQKARQESIQALADEFGVTSVNDDFLPQIVRSLSKRQASELEKAGIQRNQAVDKLVRFGDVPTNTAVKEIDKQIARQERLGAKANQELVNNLNNIKSSLQGDFSLIKDIRTEVISDLKALARADDQRAEGALQAVKSAIDKDLNVFARKNDRAALKDWLTSNRKFAFELSKARDTELKRLIQRGDTSPKVVAPILRSGDPTELNRLNSSLTPKGQASARSAIIKDALENSGFFTDANPDRLATALGKPKTQRAIDIFFNEEQKQQLKGLTKLLDKTRRAQQAAVSTATGQQLVPIAVGGGAIVDPLTAFLTGTSLAAVTRGYESKVVRDSLLKLAAAKSGSKEEIELLNQLSPIITSSIQSVRAGEQ